MDKIIYKKLLCLILWIIEYDVNVVNFLILCLILWIKKYTKSFYCYKLKNYVIYIIIQLYIYIYIYI